jgi:hypothetical protein
MKHEKLIYAIGSIIVIGAAIMKILHLPYANGIMIFGFVGMSIYQSWLVTHLKRRIKKLEEKAAVQ